MTPSPVTITPLARTDESAVIDLDQWAFGFDDHDVDSTPAMDAFEWDRTFGAWLEEPHRLAGVNSTYSFEVAVPGAQLPAAGLTWVGVHPRDRRRGVLSAMMRHHLHDVHDRGREPISMLYAAEPAIYGRFGYGLGARQLNVTLPRGAQLRPVPGADEVQIRMERLDVERHGDELARCFEVARIGRPGWPSRSAALQFSNALRDPPAQRKGSESLRLMIAHDGDDVRGYAIFRRKAAWTHGSPDGTLEVTELVTRDPAAHRAIWGRLVDLDLISRVEVSRVALDDPLLHLVVDLRATTPRLYDSVWVRVVDVPAALAGRRYAREVDLVLEVIDTLCPWNAGRWQVQGDLSGAECVATHREPDARLDVRELGAAYLGGTSLAALARAGLLEVINSKAVDAASLGFGWDIAPFCPWDF